MKASGGRMLGVRTNESTQTMNIMTKFMKNRPKTAGKVFAARINAHGACHSKKNLLNAIRIKSKRTLFSRTSFVFVF